MCITVAEAELSDTIIYAAEARRPSGEIVHVLGYQNKVSGAKGPNAMLLPFPAAGTVGRGNLVNAAEFAGVLGDYDEAVERLRPMTKGVGARGFDGAAALDAYSDAFDVFESGSYTVALVQRAPALRAALEMMPERVRPNMTTSMIFQLGKLYPDWPMALCCFENGMSAPEPLFWWYEPRFPDRLFAPGLDAHDGGPPDLARKALRSHTLAFAALDSDRPIDAQLQKRLFAVPEEHQWLLSARVCGRKIHDLTPNGDFVYPLSQIQKRSPYDWGWLPVRIQSPTEAWVV
jgi:hypothetical protein